MASEERQRRQAGATGNGGVSTRRIDDAARNTVRDMAETAPPKSLDTIKAAGAVTEAVLQDHVRRRAYDIWDHEGRPPGNGVNYWVRAEKEVLDEVRAG